MASNLNNYDCRRRNLFQQTRLQKDIKTLLLLSNCNVTLTCKLKTDFKTLLFLLSNRLEILKKFRNSSASPQSEPLLVPPFVFVSPTPTHSFYYSHPFLLQGKYNLSIYLSCSTVSPTICLHLSAFVFVSPTLPLLVPPFKSCPLSLLVVP